MSINNQEIVTVERIMNSANLQYLKLWNTGIVSSDIFAIPNITSFSNKIIAISKINKIETTCALLLKILAKVAVEIKSSYTPLHQHRETQQTLLPNCIG